MNIVELLSTLASWKTLLAAIVVYGFAPGFVLRILVRAYEREDPRRDELVAELYTVPRPMRPFWVAEQFETVIFDGLGPRLKWAATGRIILRWHLLSGVKQNREHPKSFEIPSDDEKAKIEPGVFVKLMFEQSDGWVERMWVEVERIGRRRITGRLTNEPLGFPRLNPGNKIKFHRKHIIDIHWPSPCEDDALQKTIESGSGVEDAA